MPIPFIDKPPSEEEVERLRLLLSTFQDGTGQNAGGTKPGWRDFERVVAILLGGEAVENKAIFDVQVDDPTHPTMKYGVACKMRGQLRYLDNHKRITVEVSNSNQKFWEELRRNGITHSNFREQPHKVGELIVSLIEKWQEAVSIEHSGDIDLGKSCYLVLTYDSATNVYILHQLSLELPNPESLVWSYPSEKRIVGKDGNATVLEWYYDAGGQLKYYPRADAALWATERFTLEPLPEYAGENSILVRAQAYFPELWAKTESGTGLGQLE